MEPTGGRHATFTFSQSACPRVAFVDKTKSSGAFQTKCVASEEVFCATDLTTGGHLDTERRQSRVAAIVGPCQKGPEICQAPPISSG